MRGRLNDEVPQHVSCSQATKHDTGLHVSLHEFSASYNRSTLAYLTHTDPMNQLKTVEIAFVKRRKTKTCLDDGADKTCIMAAAQQ